MPRKMPLRASSLYACCSFTGCKRIDPLAKRLARQRSRETALFSVVAALVDAIEKDLREKCSRDNGHIPEITFFRKAHAMLVKGRGGRFSAVYVLRHAAE